MAFWGAEDFEEEEEEPGQGEVAFWGAEESLRGEEVFFSVKAGEEVEDEEGEEVEDKKGLGELSSFPSTLPPPKETPEEVP